VHLPIPRGELSRELAAALLRPPQPLPDLVDRARVLVADGTEPLGHEDLQLSLYVLYELHYQGFDGVDAAWEWSPDLLATCAVLEWAFESALRTRVRPPRLPPARSATVAQALSDLVAADDGPPLSTFLAREASAEQFREFLVHRSVYQLKEADPHTWVIPRLAGRPKAALAEVQIDEYGGGRRDRMHAALFARTLRVLGLDDAHGSHVDRVPAGTLAWVNAMSLFGLHRRLRGAAVGHLAAYELTSTVPNRRYGDGLRRLGVGGEATWFFDEHVEADAVHEQIAAHDLCGALAEDEPALVPDLLFGAGTALEMDRLLAGALLEAWSAGRSSLRAPASLPDVA
jgi:hypothetical protein